jgi:hypothetical protein
MPLPTRDEHFKLLAQMIEQGRFGVDYGAGESFTAWSVGGGRGGGKREWFHTHVDRAGARVYPRSDIDLTLVDGVWTYTPSR